MNRSGVSSPPWPELGSAVAPVDDAPRWIRVGAVFDGTDVKRDMHVVYDSVRIRWLATEPPAAGVLEGEARVPSLVLPDVVLLPGLVEAHAHLFLAGGEEDPANRAAYLQQDDAFLLAQAERRLPRLLALGVLAVRDAGDRNGVGLTLAARQRGGATRGLPLVESPGAALHHQGRYGAFMGHPIEEYPDIEAAVAARIQAGAHHVKLLATGIINFEKGSVTSRPQMDVDELTRAVAAAHRQERQVMVHCSGHDGVENCLQSKVDTIEHGFFISDEQLARMRDQDIAWVPTLAPVQYQLDQAETLGWNGIVRTHLRRILEEHAKRLRRAEELGVRVIAGSDAGSHGVPHGLGLWRELELMEAAGMSTRAVLRSATGAAARLRLTGTAGTLHVGDPARFVVTDISVLQSVRQPQRQLLTVCDGAVFEGGDGSDVLGL